MFKIINLNNGKDIVSITDEELKIIEKTLQGKGLAGYIYYIDKGTLLLLSRAGMKGEFIDKVKGHLERGKGVDIGIETFQEGGEWTIRGKVVNKTTGEPVIGVKIEAFDKDMIEDDLLGWAFTNYKGEFEISYNESDFNKPLEFLEGNPDIYLVIRNRIGKELSRTDVRWEASKKEFFIIEI